MPKVTKITDEEKRLISELCFENFNASIESKIAIVNHEVMAHRPVSASTIRRIMAKPKVTPCIEDTTGVMISSNPTIQQELNESLEELSVDKLISYHKTFSEFIVLKASRTVDAVNELIRSLDVYQNMCFMDGDPTDEVKDALTTIAELTKPFVNDTF